MGLFSQHHADKKIFSVVSIGDSALKSVPANELIQKLCPLMGAKGGGKPNQAQAGGDKFENMELVVQAFKDLVFKTVLEKGLT